MVSFCKRKSAGVLLTLAIFLSIDAPMCQASIDSHKMLLEQNMPKRTTPPKAANGNIRPNNYGKVSGPFLSEPEVRQLIEKAGFPPKTISTMLQIASCESSFSVTAKNVNRDGTIDVGLFQINERNWKGCNISQSELSDPYNNARCAYQIWQHQGYNAWSCYSHT
ncbi:MAG: transglycosylase SLT domain-containing protein [Deltaproteobacteria bacterium]|nr:transglycosylase SLT domain-containing protein [Deltaproteobacteria bacterium]